MYGLKYGYLNVLVKEVNCSQSMIQHQKITTLVERFFAT
jgi:hypothetical protein